MGFKNKLKELLKEKLSEEELNLLPRGFQIIGKVIILKLHPKLVTHKEIIANKYLEQFTQIKSVYINLGKIRGKFRSPERIEYIAGIRNPIVKHREHGIIYKFDLTKIMFSKGNLKERRFLATLVNQNEVIVDMFAGIGYFSLSIGKHSKVKKIFSIELNPYSYKFLLENIKLNHLEDIIFPINGDSKDEVLKLSKSGVKADRVIMGVFPAPKEFISEALTLAKVSGTIYHYEGVIEKEKFMNLYNEFKDFAESKNFSCKLLSKRFVKSYGPNLHHTVLDILVKIS